MTTGATVAEVLAFARSGTTNYDDIATRVWASSPFAGPSPLHTLAGETRRQPTPEAFKRARLQNLREAAMPLSFEPELPSRGRVGFELTSDLVRLRLHHEGGEVVRRMSLGHPPRFMLHGARPDPAVRLLGQQGRVGGEAKASIWWLPFQALLQQGRFVRMQDCRLLTKPLEPNAFYLLVSHRWLDLEDPDPEGAQAAAVAWQWVANVIEAIWVRAARGARGARLRSDAGQAIVGPHGSELAESIVVNLLASLDDEEFGALEREAASFEDVEGDRGVGHAREDVGLSRLRERLAETPALRSLTSRLRLWYDFNCLPQHPRTEAEQAEFERVLQSYGGECAVNQASARRSLGRRGHGRQPDCRHRHPAPDRDALELGDRPRGTDGWRWQGQAEGLLEGRYGSTSRHAGREGAAAVRRRRSQAAVEWRGAVPAAVQAAAGNPRLAVEESG